MRRINGIARRFYMATAESIFSSTFIVHFCQEYLVYCFSAVESLPRMNAASDKLFQISLIHLNFEFLLKFVNQEHAYFKGDLCVSHFFP